MWQRDTALFGVYSHSLLEFENKIRRKSKIATMGGN